MSKDKIEHLDHPLRESSVQAAPEGYISTKTAISEAVDRERLDLLDLLLADLHSAIGKRQLVPLAWRKLHGREWHELDVTFWKSSYGFDSVVDGAVCHIALSAASMRLARAPLYFKRPDWDRWIKAWTKRVEKGKAAALSDIELEVAADAWLRQEMVRRIDKTGEDRSWPAMVVVLRDKFPNLQDRRARKLIQALPKKLRPKRGPAKGSRRVSLQN